MCSFSTKLHRATKQEENKSMDNLEFLQSIGVTNPETQQKCLEAMEKYEENHWWEPDTDPRKFAYYQLNEPILFTNDFSHFHESLELLLGRLVYTHEFGIAADALCADALCQEAERAWTYQVGVTSEAEKQERVGEQFIVEDGLASTSTGDIFMKEIHHYCEVGQHDVGDGYLMQCVICERAFCYEHQGNPNTLAGFYVGCLEHGEQAEALNRARIARYWERQRKDEQE
jgi:hypothetical protein